MKKSALSGVFLTLVYSFFNFSFGQEWQALNPPLNIFNGTIYAATSDATGKIYAGGNFRNAANNNFVARWDGTDWSELGSGAAALNANGSILTLATYGNTIYAAGGFTKNSRAYVAKWDGASWSELDSANSLHANGPIYAIAVDKSGNVYAAGGFTNASSKHYVAKWNGKSWSELGGGPTALNANNAIFALAVDTFGDVYAGGYFANASGKEYVAKWDGNAWTELGSGSNALNANDFISCLATDNNGKVYVAGRFRNNNNEYYLAKWDGTTWSEVGGGANALHANGAINTIAVKSPTEIYTAGLFTTGVLNYYVARWDGATWSELNNLQSPLLSNDAVQTLAIDAHNNVYAAGKFLNKSGHSFVSKWNGSGWNQMGDKGDPFYTNQSIYQILGDSLGHVYVASGDVDAGGLYVLHYWNGSSWEPLQPGYTTALSINISGKHPMAVDGKGNLYVTGRKMIGFGSYYDCVLKWDGGQWSILENFPNSLGVINTYASVAGVNEIEMDPLGNLFVAGNFNDSTYSLCSLAKWDGTTWSRLPGSYSDLIQNFCVGTGGRIYAYGGFKDEHGRLVIASFHPSKQRYWEEVKNGVSKLTAVGYNIFMSLALDSKDNLYVNGDFTNASGQRYIAKWDGSSWSELGPTDNLGWDLAIDARDNIYGNRNQSSDLGDPVKRWNGSSWVGVGIPVGTNGVYPSGRNLAADVLGNVYTTASSQESGVGNYIAKYGATIVPPPRLISFTPTTGSLGTTVTVKGKNLTGTGEVRFGGTKASSFKVLNDTMLTAVVAGGATGSVLVATLSGVDSMQTFTYTCDSVKGPVPYVVLLSDTVLASSYAEYYQWYYNNQKIENEATRLLQVNKAGFYRVETSSNKLCWVPSLDYPIIINRNSPLDSLNMNLYPNPSGGSFTVYVKLPQTSTVKTYVQVFDISGVQILQTNKLIFYGSEIRIPLTINSKGNFFVKVFVNDHALQQSIIIM